MDSIVSNVLMKSGNLNLAEVNSQLNSSVNANILANDSLNQRTQDFKVVVRVRPPLSRELSSEPPFQNVVLINENHNAITFSDNLPQNNDSADGSSVISGISNNSSARYSAPMYDGLHTNHVFTFDHVYGPDSKQVDVYNITAKQAVMSTLKGYNATIIAYGQTGSGKTYTMEGYHQESQRGIIPRAIDDIFTYIKNCKDANTRFLVRASYLQIHNEIISDLLKTDRTRLEIRSDPKRGVFVEGISEWIVRNPEEIYGLMTQGSNSRASGSTKMNELSSRSHGVFMITTEIAEINSTNGNMTVSVGKLNLVDLAGSERVKYSGASGKALEESKKINQSLSCLGNVIAALTDVKGRPHIPYRDSKLTRLLEDSLGGNCKTTMIAMISPALDSFLESLSTLKFANRAKNIKNAARINLDLNEKGLLRKYEQELKRLRQELQERSRNVVDKRKLLELEEQRRRAEEDKVMALRELEKKTREFMKEKEEKLELESTISALQSQMLQGSRIAQNILIQEHERLEQDYREKLNLLEKERQAISEDKAQVERLKGLLLKQREIMLALNNRLNEKHAIILSLQQQCDTHAAREQALEDALDKKNAEFIYLERKLAEASSSSCISNNLIKSTENNNNNDSSNNNNNNNNNSDINHRNEISAEIPTVNNWNKKYEEMVQRKEAEHQKLIQMENNNNLLKEENDKLRQELLQLSQRHPNQQQLQQQQQQFQQIIQNQSKKISEYEETLNKNAKERSIEDSLWKSAMQKRVREVINLKQQIENYEHGIQSIHTLYTRATRDSFNSPELTRAIQDIIGLINKNSK